MIRLCALLLFAIVSLPACQRRQTAASLPKEAPLPPVTATASVDRASISTEDTAVFSVTINRDETVEVAVPDIGSRISGFRVTDFGSEDSEDRPRKRKIVRKWFSLRADVTGSYVLPETEIKYTLDGKEASVKTAEIFVEVKAPAAKDDKAPAEELKDIKDIENSPNQIGYWIGGLAAATALAGFGYFIYRRRKNRVRIIPRLPPHEEALQRLGALILSTEPDSIALKKYYFSLSEIARIYVEDRYGFRATDMTSEEVTKNLRQDASVPEGLKPEFVAFLKETDLIKFTDTNATSETAALAKERLIAFIRKNEPVDLQAQAQAQAGTETESML